MSGQRCWASPADGTPLAERNVLSSTTRPVQGSTPLSLSPCRRATAPAGKTSAPVPPLDRHAPSSAPPARARPENPPAPPSQRGQSRTTERTGLPQSVGRASGSWSASRGSVAVPDRGQNCTVSRNVPPPAGSRPCHANEPIVLPPRPKAAVPPSVLY